MKTSRSWSVLFVFALFLGGNSANSDTLANPNRDKDDDRQYQVGLEDARWNEAYNIYREGLLTGVCQIHHKKLFQETVTVKYGQPLYAAPAPGEPTDVFRFTHFPHAMQYELGGHITLRPRTIDMYVCPDCLKAQEMWERKWYKDHPACVDPTLRDKENEKDGNKSSLF